MDEKRQDKGLKNEAEKAGKKSRGAGRTRVYAIMVYEDSAPKDWRERLTQEHVDAFACRHDKDKNPDGSAKKTHWHLMVMFDGVKTPEQVEAMWDRVLGPDRVVHYETVNSTRGYARYLCHMDNPEKAQYARGDVVSWGAADYEEVVSLPSDDWEVLDQIFDYIEAHEVKYYSEFMRYCRKERRDWWKLLVKRHSYVIISYLKAETQRRRDDVERATRDLVALTPGECAVGAEMMAASKARSATARVLKTAGLKVDEATGEIVARKEQTR